MTSTQITYKYISEPPLGQTITKSIGDELLLQGNFASLKTVIIKQDALEGKVKSGIYKQIGTILDDEIYIPIIESGANIEPIFLTDSNNKYLAYDPKKKLLCRGLINGFGAIFCQNTITKEFYSFSSMDVVAINNFQQGLIYTGKQGSVVKFLYREFKNDVARPAFNVEITYDLTDNTEIGFKNAKLKILEATNSSITYIVLSNFK